MNRAYYKNSISSFITESDNSILGQLSLKHTNKSLEDLQRNAWIKQINILKNQLVDFEGSIYFEFAIPRMGKRVDNIIIINDCVFVVEFKVGDNKYGSHAETQVIDYALDLLNFHEGSHSAKLIPILVAKNAYRTGINTVDVSDLTRLLNAIKKELKKQLNYLSNLQIRKLIFIIGKIQSINLRQQSLKPHKLFIKVTMLKKYLVQILVQ